MLTGEDIRRGGFTTLPEALRMVPGLYVVQINSHSWQVSARGFSEFNNNKMLVLVNGRTVYSPLTGGVLWDALDIPIENIERIEAATLLVGCSAFLPEDNLDELDDTQFYYHEIIGFDVEDQQLGKLGKGTKHQGSLCGAISCR